MTDLFERLAAEFPRDAVHWRAQTLTQDGNKALALAYLDARDVMDRLDDVCGPAGWKNSYVETPKGRVIATIYIRVGDEWIGKSDGAGDTAVEGEKGGVSDALKRAAVCWGIGRYLYRLPSVWAPCEFYEKSGKKHWKAWKGSPWDHVRAKPSPKPEPKPEAAGMITDDQRDQIATLAEAAGVTLLSICERAKIEDLRDLPADQFAKVIRKLNLTIDSNLAKKEAA